MSPHERVEKALAHEQPDRVPFDFWAVPEVLQALCQFLEVQSLEEVLQLFRSVALGGRRFGAEPDDVIAFAIVGQHAAGGVKVERATQDGDGGHNNGLFHDT